MAKGIQGEGGSLLVFLPGVGEISRLCGDLSRGDEGGRLHVLPLHGALPAADQQKVR